MAGIFPAVTTKFHADESLDLDGTARHIDYVICNGVHGIVTWAPGRGQHLTLEEKAAGRRLCHHGRQGRVPVLANVSGNLHAGSPALHPFGQCPGVSGYMVMPLGHLRRRRPRSHG